MDSIINVLKEKLNYTEELGTDDLKEYVDTVPLLWYVNSVAGQDQ